MSQIRPFKPDDARAILNIYKPIVLETAITFETEPPAVEEIKARYQRFKKTHPWLVLERDGKVVGYAYAAPFKQRPAYNKTAEISVYMSDAARGNGNGSSLLDVLLQDLKQRGFEQVIAITALPNPGSMRLFERAGFEKRGELSRVGYKFERWHDIALYQRSLTDLE